MEPRRLILLCALLGIVVAGSFAWRKSSSERQRAEGTAVAIEKQPVIFAAHTLDPNAPPADMPRLAYGEEAACDSDLSSNTSVKGISEKIDASHATVTITNVKMILHLSVNIWVPTGVTQHVMEHENGHRQISEAYYQTADKLAEQIAAGYLGKQIAISGTDLDARIQETLQQTATEITSEFDKSLNLEATQQYYDTITNHARNETDAKEAVAAALANTRIASTHASSWAPAESPK